VAAVAPKSVLFICGQNSVRSPMAAAIMRHLFPSRTYVASAGIRTGEIDHFAVVVMDELGLDISAHEPQTLAELGDLGFDLVVTLAPEAHHAAMELTRITAFEVEYWPTFDPTVTTGSREQVMDAYRAVRDDLMAHIRRRFSERRFGS
jgi:protein-tyrosine-phosphatase